MNFWEVSCAMCNSLPKACQIILTLVLWRGAVWFFDSGTWLKWLQNWLWRWLNAMQIREELLFSRVNADICPSNSKWEKWGKIRGWRPWKIMLKSGSQEGPTGRSFFANQSQIKDAFFSTQWRHFTSNVYLASTTIFRKGFFFDL